MIPNHIHFIFFGFTEFVQIHYWAVKSALAVHQPTKVFLHYTQAPKHNPLWDEIAQLVQLTHIDPPTELNGVELGSYQYKADVARLEILIKHGGIYLDIDVISLKPFGKLLSHSCVLGVESADHSSYSNAVILAEPNHPFVIEWLKQTADNLVKQKWAHHAVCLPKQILDSGTWSVHIEPRESFMPFDFRDESILSNEYHGQLDNSYTVHLWETIWWNKLINLAADSYLATLCQQYSKRLKIAVYTICKNEQSNVAGWAASNSEADYRLVCDTGSTDDTVAQLHAHAVTVVPITVTPWRFDMARGTSLNLLPADIDVCIWQDLDERLLPGWREEIEAHWTLSTTIANHKYRNNNNPWQWHSKIHARHGCHWTGAVHEELRWQVTEHAIWLPNLFLDEHQDVTKSRSSYLELLQTKVAEGDKSWRTLYFLANELGVAGRVQPSIETRITSYENCADGDITKSYIARNIAHGYASINQLPQADQWFQTAVSHSNEREAWFAYAEYCAGQSDWDRCYIYAKKCLAVSHRRDGFTQDPRAWSEVIYDIAARAAYHLGLHRIAVEYGAQAVAMQSADPRLQRNLEFYQEAANG